MSLFYYFSFLVFALTACSKKSIPPILSNPTQQVSGIPSVPLLPGKDALIAQLKSEGTLLGVQTSQLDRNYEVVSTINDDQYFIKGDRVVSSSRRPKAKERALIYWRNIFKGHLYEENEASTDLHGHSRPLLQLSCDSLGQGVLYDPNQERVIRIFYYEKK